MTGQVTTCIDTDRHCIPPNTTSVNCTGTERSSKNCCYPGDITEVVDGDTLFEKPIRLNYTNTDRPDLITSIDACAMGTYTAANCDSNARVNDQPYFNQVANKYHQCLYNNATPVVGTNSNTVGMDNTFPINTSDVFPSNAGIMHAPIEHGTIESDGNITSPTYATCPAVCTTDYLDNYNEFVTSTKKSTESVQQLKHHIKNEKTDLLNKNYTEINALNDSIANITSLIEFNKNKYEQKNKVSNYLGISIAILFAIITLSTIFYSMNTSLPLGDFINNKVSNISNLMNGNTKKSNTKPNTKPTTKPNANAKPNTKSNAKSNTKPNKTNNNGNGNNNNNKNVNNNFGLNNMNNNTMNNMNNNNNSNNMGLNNVSNANKKNANLM
jgi:hypothetical protein